MNNVVEYLVDYKKRVEPEIKKIEEEWLVEASGAGAMPAHMVEMFFKLLRGGKFLRGFLVELAYEGYGGTKDQNILRASLVMEILQTGLLIHDDFMDRDKLRRGQPTFHTQIAQESEIDESLAGHYGDTQAINMGDISFFKAISLIAESEFGEAQKLAVLKEMGEGIARVGLGQILDMANSQQGALPIDEVLKVHDYKTAEYTGRLPLLLGAALAGMDDRDELLILSKVGMGAGRAFQVQDDIIGVFGKVEELGKDVGQDVKEGRNTMLMALLRKMGSKEQVMTVESFRNKEIDETTLATVRKIFVESGVYKEVVESRDSMLKLALEDLSGLKMKQVEKEKLKQVVEFLVAREK